MEALYPNTGTDGTSPASTFTGRPIRPDYGVSLGIMYDPKRSLIWASDVRGNVFVMRFERKTARIFSLE
ncbi:MAG: hypothetical protein AMS14_06650 [Planctomycetes bacterium DG_20]|nr:MAG: hypothetical protein AMS14_06650 [Planctomycetes bacterium DG_20]